MTSTTTTRPPRSKTAPERRLDADTLAGLRLALDDKAAGHRRRLQELTGHIVAIDHAAIDIAKDWTDHAASIVERDWALSMLSRSRRALQDIDEATSRLDTEVYGICDACREPIPLARLEALPECRLCVDCQGGGRIRGAGAPGRRR